MPRHLLTTLLVAALLAPPVIAQRAPSLRDVLDRTGAYVIEYGQALSTIIADEEYVQELVGAGGTVLERRVLHAEMAFVRLANSTEWQAFRHVVRVDGEPVPGAERRLARLFQLEPYSVIAQARQIGAESARYNLGPLVRTFNAPTMPLQFLHPAHQDRFRFTREGETRVGDEVAWTVRFRDRGGATLIRSPGGRPVPIDGRFVIVPGDGRVMRASFVATGFLPDERGRPRARGELLVEWREDERLGLWVPAEMHERYEGPWGDEHLTYEIVGTARYVDYRRFEVDARVLDRVR
jgi:hypothetical protein